MLISDLSSEQLLMLIVPALPNMWALKHAMYHDFPTTKEKYRWMMACVFVPCLAGVAYYFVGRKRASKEKVDIRARMEAERARAAGEKAKAEDSAALSGTLAESAGAAGESAALAGAAGSGALAPAGEAAMERAEAAGGEATAKSEALTADAANTAEASAEAPVADAAAKAAEKADARPRPSGAVRAGDDWSFGCPDDVRKP